MEKPLLTIREVAGLLRVSEKTVRNLINRGHLPHYRIGVGRGAIRVSEEALADHLAQSEAATQSAPKTRKNRPAKTALKHIKL